MLLVLFCAIFAVAVPARAISTPAVFRVAPSDCSDAGGDRYAALAQAVAHRRAHGPTAPSSSTLNVSCALPQRTPAVQLPHGSTRCVARRPPWAGGFRGRAAGSRGAAARLLLIDYRHGGCGAVVAANSSDVRVQNLEIDALRLPYSGRVAAADATERS